MVMIRTADDGLEGFLDVGGFESRRLDEGKSLLLSKCLGLFGGDSTKVTKIALVSDEHDDDVGRCCGVSLAGQERYERKKKENSHEP